jgi:hypothetical protein
MDLYCERCGVEGGLRTYTDRGNGDKYPLCRQCYQMKARDAA